MWRISICADFRPIGISFYGAIVFGLGMNILFESVLGHCSLKTFDVKIFMYISKLQWKKLGPIHFWWIEYTFHEWVSPLKFIYFEKATRIWWHLPSKIQINLDIALNFCGLFKNIWSLWKWLHVQVYLSVIYFDIFYSKIKGTKIFTPIKFICQTEYKGLSFT